MKSKYIRAILIGVWAIALLIGCQSAQPAGNESAGSAAGVQSAGAARLITPQELISKAEAENILGESVRDCTPSENAAVGQSLCFYDSQDETSFRFLQIAITQQAAIPSENGITPQTIYDTTKDTFGPDALPVDGIGDEAMLVSGGYSVMSDGYLLQISAGNTDDETVLSILDQASRLAVANLQSHLGQ
ncbi:MAG: hypothetical protein PWQ55_2283 [Chloroflexota bacterium]|nr:hypothetical protein [Chloroflexota bacterium]